MRVDGKILQAVLDAEAATACRDLEVFVHPLTPPIAAEGVSEQCMGYPVVRSFAVQPDTARVFDRQRMEWVA